MSGRRGLSNGGRDPEFAGPAPVNGRRGPVLLNPGPVNLSDRVRRALLAPDLCHREPEFADLQDEIRRRLLEVYGLDPDRWTAVLLSGSGTAAVEAMLTGLIPPDGRLLVVENGVYGERMTRIAEAHGIPHSALRLEWGAAVPTEAVTRALEAAEPTHVAIVHHETTTGRLNDLAAVAAACRRAGVRLLVDGVSSFAGEEIDFEGWGLAACAASANKCLHGVPGAAFVILDRGALPPGDGRARSVYLDLGAHARAQDRRDTPFTPAVPCFHALAEALRELREGGGWRARHEGYARLAAIVEEGLGTLGLHPLLPRGESSVVLRAYRLPADVSYAELHDALKARGFVIYAGQGGLARRIFRVSTMGALEAADLRAFVRAAGEALEDRGRSTNPGSPDSLEG